ncbi:hypothetical protein E6C27_scaffold538G00590 [Cucumis melo var. makuwa]|uniref:Ubiquitin-like protease family profile domain-containing protein n=1 Tax=Cucumis melo var. makuwa TaxID=1194695 RepID=A0A5A7VJI5_CUCMM|nr:hypothetical protein E6C27_scaffold538G00590 [Cucumis melo var. makuwa]
MKYEKIHACRNDCSLFRKELSDANVCPSCGMSRWKIPKNSKKEVKNVPVKVMWYFSPIPRFERMFRSKETSKLLTWHGRKREVNDLLQHPKDALSWKKIDNLWPEFGSEPRNLRLALSTDGSKDIMHVQFVGRKLHQFICEKEGRWHILGIASFYHVFNGAQELELAPEPLSGEEIFIQTNVMHIEKNVCANLIGTLLDIPGKTKDGVKSRLDLVELNIRSELAPQVGEKKIFLPPTCYTLSRAEKLSFCKTLSELKVPEGYSSNIQSLVSLTDLKLYGLKSHDHHVLMQQLLPVAIRGILPKHVALALEVPKNSITPSLRWIAHGPSPDVATYSGYIINGYYYHTKRTIEEDFFEDEIGDMLQECGYETIKRMPNVDTPNETDDTNSTYIRHDCEGRWVEKVRNITAIFMMEDSSEDEREMLPEVRKKSFVPRGPTTMSELVLVRNSGQKLLIQFNEHEQPVGATSKKMQSYIGVCVRQQIPITYNSWKDVPNELKDKIYDCISMSFDLQPNAKHSILMSASRKFRTFKTTLTQKLSEEWEDELVATNKNEDILTDALGSKEHGGRIRGKGAFVSQSQYFNTVKGKEKMCHKEEDDSRCKSDKKRSNHSRSSIGSINIDLDADEDTPTNKGVEGTPCQLSIGSINNIVAVATIVEDNIGCPNVKVLVDVVTGENLTIPNPVKGKIETLNQALGNIIEWPRRLEHSTRKDVVYPSNYTDVNGIIKLLNRHAMNNMEDVDMIRIPMNELIFGSDKFVYLAREDLLHYCGMVEIGYMCILAYITCLWDKCDCAKNFFVIDQSKISSHIKDRDLRSRNLANQLEAVNLEQKVLIPYNTGFHWMLHVIDLRENCVYVLDSLRSKVNEDIHGIINVGLKTWQAKHDLQRYRSTPKWRPVKCPRQSDSVGCGYYVQKYIHEIVQNFSTSITNLFNTKNAYRQEEIDEIRTEWAAFVSRFV